MKLESFLAICCWSFCLVQADFRPIRNPADLSNNKTGLSCLNEDCQMEVLERMDLVDLMVMAKTSQYYENLATNVFLRKYSKQIFMISNEFTESILLFDKKIVEIKIDLAEEILSAFGHMITSAMINSMKIQNEDQSRRINELLRQYCSESLIEYYIFGFTENPLNEISTTFKNVKYVSLDGVGNDPVTIGNETVKLPDVFPSLERLYISVNQLANKEYVNIVYPHLKHLQLELSASGMDTETVEGILEKNPQIKNVDIKPATMSLLTKLNEIIPNLEALAFDLGIMNQGVDHNEAIRFKHVKRLSVSVDLFPSNLFFPELEEAQFCNLNLKEGWVEFFAKFPTIKKFNATIYTMGGKLDAAKLQTLAVQLPNLTELGFRPNENLTKIELVDFFEKNPKLEKIFLSVSPTNFSDDLKKEISEDFYVTASIDKWGWGIVTIERNELE